MYFCLNNCSRVKTVYADFTRISCWITSHDVLKVLDSLKSKEIKNYSTFEGRLAPNSKFHPKKSVTLKAAVPSYQLIRRSTAGGTTLHVLYIFWLNALGHVNSSVRISNQNNWSGWRYAVHVTTLPVRMYNFLFIPIGSCVKVSVNTSCTRTKMHEHLFIFCIFKCYKLTRPPSSCTWKSLLHRAACCWETPAVREKKTKQIKDQFSRLLNVNEDILQRRSSLGCSCTVNYNQSVMFKQPRGHFVIDFCN